MSESKFPKGWDEERVKRLIDHYEGISEDEMVAEHDSAMEEGFCQVVISVPVELLPAILQVLANHETI